MSNKLFVICPLACMETFLQNTFGKRSFFLSATGGVFHTSEYDYLNAVKDLIIRQGITSIIVVNDLDCPLIETIIHRKKLFGLESERVLESIYIDNYSTLFKRRSEQEQTRILAELNVRKQIAKLSNSPIIGSVIEERHIEISGLITSRKINLIHQTLRSVQDHEDHQSKNYLLT